MFKRRKYEDGKLFLLRCTARSFAAFCLAILFLLILGENLEDLLNMTANDLYGWLFFPVGLMLGLLIAWRREFLGGAISLGSMLAYYLIDNLLLNGSLTEARWCIVFAIPSVLFIAYGIGNTGEIFAGNKVRI